jgi:hypothetical protein
LLDIGSGPTIYQLISAAQHMGDIYIAEYLPVNRSYLQQWLEGGSQPFSWHEYYQVISSFDGRADSATLEKKLRDAVRAIVPIDILGNGLLPESVPVCMIAFSSSFSVPNQSALTGDVLTMLLIHNPPCKTRGLLIMLLIRDAPFYHAGDDCFPAFPVNEALLADVLASRNYSVLRMTAVDAEPGRDYSGLIFCGARHHEKP